MAESYISVGKLGKPHGIGGAFWFLLHRELKSKKRWPNYFIVASKKSATPQFIKTIEWTGDGEGLVSFEDITTLELAKTLAGSELLLLDKDIPAFFKKADDGFSFLKGYMAIDETEGIIGRVDQIIEHPGQILLTIENKDVLIPLAEDLIVEINKRKKEITFSLPEGLLDL